MTIAALEREGLLAGRDRGLLPRLLAGAPASGKLTLAGHLSVHGPLPEHDPDTLIDIVRASGMHGRGGAAFPTEQKLAAVRESRGRAIVVANCVEGEPASAKDRMLLGSLPHLVLDGAVVAARAVGAREAIIAIAGGVDRIREAVTSAIAERDDPVRLRLKLVEDSYLSGQETALVAQLNGRPALPTLTPPHPFVRGVRGAPTLILNAETLAHLGLIARHGSAWFRMLGPREEPGSTLVTLLGAVTHPGVFEVATDMSVGALLRSAGGQRERVRALLIGGYHGTWVDERALRDLSLGSRSLERHGASRGAGVIGVLGVSACGAAETSRVLSYLAGQSAGQCGPCVHGLAALAELVEQLVAGEAPPDATELLGRWLVHVPGRGACRMPDGAVRFLASALQVFGREFGEHSRYGHCSACSREPVLPVA